MSITPKNTLKGWFLTALKPLQAHYHAWMDSYWHKDEIIPAESVDIEIPDFPDPEVIENLITIVQEYVNPVTIEAEGPTTIQMPAGKLLQNIVVLSPTEQTVWIGTSPAGKEVLEDEVVPSEGHCAVSIAIYNQAESSLYLGGYSNPLTIKLYYR